MSLRAFRMAVTAVATKRRVNEYTQSVNRCLKDTHLGSYSPAAGELPSRIRAHHRDQDDRLHDPPGLVS